MKTNRWLAQYAIGQINKVHRFIANGQYPMAQRALVPLRPCITAVPKRSGYRRQVEQKYKALVDAVSAGQPTMESLLSGYGTHRVPRRPVLSASSTHETLQRMDNGRGGDNWYDPVE